MQMGVNVPARRSASLRPGLVLNMEVRNRSVILTFSSLLPCANLHRIVFQPLVSFMHLCCHHSGTLSGFRQVCNVMSHLVHFTSLLFFPFCFPVEQEMSRQKTMYEVSQDASQPPAQYGQPPTPDTLSPRAYYSYAYSHAQPPPSQPSPSPQPHGYYYASSGGREPSLETGADVFPPSPSQPAALAVGGASAASTQGGGLNVTAAAAGRTVWASPVDTQREFV